MALRTDVRYVDGSGNFTQAGVQAFQEAFTAIAAQSATIAAQAAAITALEAVAISAAPGSAPRYACRAWVNFNGTGTVAIRASANVASITDNGTGDYTINFTEAMPDANYVAVVTSGNNAGAPIAFVADDATARTTTSVRVRTTNTAFALLDCSHVNVAIFR